MTASTVQLRAFELRAGPKTARLVTVGLDKSIVEVYPNLCSVLKLDAPIDCVTFHKTHNKKINTAPLSITAPIGTLGLADNDIFIIRQGYRPRIAEKEIQSNHEHSAESLLMLQSVSGHQQQLWSATASITPPEFSGVPLHASQAGSSAADKDKKNETAAACTKTDMEEMVNARHSKVCMATDVQRMESYRQQFAQHSYVTQVMVMKLFQLLAVLSRGFPTAVAQLGLMRSVVSIDELHRELLHECCQRAELPFSQVDGLLASGEHGMGAVYEALYYYTEVPMQRSMMRAKVEAWLKECLPPLQPAAQMICLLHEGQEAAYLESALLRLRGQAPTAMTWLCLKDATAQGTECCYYSSIVQFSQTCVPTHVNTAEIPVLESAELDCCCVAWGLNNSPYKGHLLPLSCWMWSRLVAAVMVGHRDASARLSDLLNMYSEWEASLAWVS